MIGVCAKLEASDLEHSRYVSSQKRLMDFVGRLTMRLDDESLLDVMVEEFLLELKADRVAYILVDEGGERTLAVSQEAVQKGVERLSLPYFLPTGASDSFTRFLEDCLDKGGVATSRWDKPVTIAPDQNLSYRMDEGLHAALAGEFNLAASVTCGAALAYPLETRMGGQALLCVQRISGRNPWSNQQKQLFENMCRFAASILEQKQLGEHVRDLKDQLSSLIESMPSAIIGMDLLGTVTSWNSRAEEFFGIKEEDALGGVFWQLVPTYAFVADTLMDVMHLDSDKGVDFEPQAQKVGDGSIRYLKANLFTMFGRDRGEVALRIDDVTRTVELNHQLFHSQRMETVGTLAGGLAHDFNNVLGGIIGTTSLMKDRLQKNNFDKSAYEQDLEIIEACTERATSMVQRLLALSHKKDMAVETLDLNALIQSLVPLCQISFEARIRIHPELAVDPVWIRGDKSQLEQAFLNICVNARDAMPAGGTLSIRVEKARVDEAFRSRHPSCTAAELAVLVIKDTGEGIALENLDRIFDPFFSTKSENGSGLGLSIVDAIVKRHQGYMEVNSSPKQGCEFKLYFSVAQPGIRAKAAAGESIPSGGGTVLIVDDDEIMRKTTGRMLAELGYRVATAATGASALSMLENGQRSDLVLMDVDLPGMNGLDTAEVLRKARPDVKIIFCTGRYHQYDMGHLLQLPNTWIIHKPFDLRQMASLVKTAFE